MLVLRPFHKKDFNVLLDLAHQAVPFAPQENEEWFRYRQAFDEAKAVRRHFIVEDGDTAVGYGSLEQQHEDPSFLRIYVVCSPQRLPGKVGNLLFDRLLAEARVLRAKRLWMRELAADVAIYQFFLSKGFVETERFQLTEPRPLSIVVMQRNVQLSG